jgi:hypothetical protein
MSIVGPRPEDPGFVALHRQEYRRILAVRPGITGLSQLAYAAESHIISDRDPVEDYITRILPQKLRLDTLYAKRSTILLDVSILRWTVVTVMLHKPVAVNRETAKMNIRRRRAVQKPAIIADETRAIVVARKPAILAMNVEAGIDAAANRATASSLPPARESVA